MYKTSSHFPRQEITHPSDLKADFVCVSKLILSSSTLSPFYMKLFKHSQNKSFLLKFYNSIILLKCLS